MYLPDDLREFLAAGHQLEYDFDACEAGRIELLGLDDLTLELYPTDVDNGPLDNKADPHYREMGCYLIPAVSLASDCANFDALGLLLWLPEEKCYGTWDSSHSLVEVFSPNVTWSQIVADPLPYLEAFWGGEERHGGMAPLVPWPKYKYSAKQLYEPLETEEADD